MSNGFEIQFLPDPPSATALAQAGVASGNYRYGEIVIADSMRERFLVPVDYWAEDSYVSQWRHGLRRIAEGEASSCLLTWVFDPDEREVTRYWALFRDGDSVVVEEHMVEASELPSEFNPTEPYGVVGSMEPELSDDERELITESPFPLAAENSRWRVSVEAVEGFLSSSST